MDRELKNFFDFLLKKVYINVVYEDSLLVESFYKSLDDMRCHFPDATEEDLFDNIVNNNTDLAVFLYRLGRSVFCKDIRNPVLKAIHWLMRDLCACEIYFSSDIGTGFLIVHGVGTVIGSRNRIGKGFKIYQGCTIGHMVPNGRGSVIGDNVTLYANSQLLGELKIGDNVTIGASTLVLKDVEPNSICYGIPAKSVQK